MTKCLLQVQKKAFGKLNDSVGISPFIGLSKKRVLMNAFLNLLIVPLL